MTIDPYAVTNWRFEWFVNETDYVTEAEYQGWSFVFPAGPDHIEAPYGLRNTATQTVLTVGPDNWGGTPMELKTDYGMAAQRFWVDWRYTG